MSDWIDALSRLAAAAEPCILVTLAEAKGSTPREAGAKMVVTADAAFGSIGGGNLEYQAIDAARDLLANPEGARRELKRFALGASLGQCCGGHAIVLFEPMPAAAVEPWLSMLRTLEQAGAAAVLVTAIAGCGETKLVVSADRAVGGLGDPERDAAATQIARAMLERGQGRSSIEELAQGCSLLFEPLEGAQPQVVLFGAGHVGKALARILAELPWHITWVDGRAEQFPDVLPAHVTVDRTALPERAVDRAPPDAIFLVMTHSHALDLKICEKILQRADFFYFGLIGSATKRAKFTRRFRLRGIPDETIARMICPIGLPGIAGKRPAEIAIAVAAQLLTMQAECAPKPSRAPSSIAS